ncbi:tetratricopeptide repeat protein [Patescibacteria group bacterium]|nr:tetratricopeptide repeat protein [Patescibacteria group bacterium]
MKSPSYSRIFNAQLPKKLLEKLIKINSKFKTYWLGASKTLKFIFLFNTLALTIILSYVSYQSYKIYEETREKRVEKLKELSYWQDILNKHPNYPDAYLKQAENYYVLGDKAKAVELLNKALLIDPNFKAASDLLNQLK